MKYVGQTVHSSRMAKAIQEQQSSVIVSTKSPASPLGWQEWVNPSTGESRLYNPATNTWQLVKGEGSPSFSQNITYSAPSRNQVDWTSGQINTKEAIYSIASGSTGAMTDGITYYLYIDKDKSKTVLQTTTSSSQSIGYNKILVCVAWPSTAVSGNTACFKSFYGQGDQITVVADNIITANLAAISADLGAITAGSITLDSSGFIKGGQTNYDDGLGFWMGYNSGAYKFSIGNSAGNKFTWDGTTLSITGSITASTGSIGGWTIDASAIYHNGATDAESSGMSSSDYPFYAGKKYANRATAPFRVTPAGALTATSATITGALTTSAGSSLDGQYLSANSVASAAANIALRGWTITCAFSVTDADTVSWGSGTLTTSDGTNYSINAGNTGNMSARNYIYLDIAVSTTALQKTTTAATAIGNGKILVATAINGTTESEFVVFNNPALNINASNIVSGSITANEIAASTITANKMNVSQLSAITADLGTITAGTITLPSTGWIKGGQTDYDTGTGFFLGYSGSAYKFSIGKDAGNKLTWSGTALSVSGVITTEAGSSIGASYLSGTIAQTNLNVADRGWTQTSAFSVTDADTIAWGNGTFTSADGTAYSITAGNTGNMSAKTYIYLDVGVSTTAYQTTTTATTAVGAGKVLIAIAENGTTEATYQTMMGQGGQNIDASCIVAGSITANEIAASTITAGKMNVSTLSSVTADLGNITAGTITLNSSGYIRGGQTDYATGTGFYLGYSGAAYKFSIGSASRYFKWDGTDIEIKGKINASTGGMYFTTVDHADQPTVTAGSAGALTGAYKYAIVYYSAEGQTDMYTTSSEVNPSSQRVELTNISTSSDWRVIGRKIYRTKAGDFTNYYLAGTIADNTTTTYTDNLPDGSLSDAGYFIGNTTALYLFLNTVKALGITYNNTFAGYNAFLDNISGHYNSIYGSYSGCVNTTGYQNTAVGYYSLHSNTTGSNNVVIGNMAGGDITGSYNINIGSYITSSAGVSNDIQIGNSANYLTCYIGGIYGVTSTAGIAVLVNSSNKLGTTTSSQRFKKDIHSISDYTDRLELLNPVSFRYKQEYLQDNEDIIQYGLIAEEVEKIYPELVTHDKEGKPNNVRYLFFIPLLLNEVIRLKKRIKKLENLIK